MTDEMQGDGLVRYLRGWNPRLLTAQQERDLARRRDQGDRTAVDELVSHNLRLVYSIARGYIPAALKNGSTLDDMLQAGTLGLIRAAEKFDGSKGFKFSTYATWWVRQAIHRFFARDRMVRIPDHTWTQLLRVGRESARLEALLERQPTAAEVAAACDLDEAQVVRLLANEYMLSLDAAVGDGEDGDDRTRADLIADTLDVVDEVADRDQVVFVQRLLTSLTERQRFVLERRFGLNGSPEMTLDQIGHELGVTRERVRQIQMHALRDLRQRLLLAA